MLINWEWWNRCDQSMHIIFKPIFFLIRAKYMHVQLIHLHLIYQPLNMCTDLNVHAKFTCRYVYVCKCAYMLILISYADWHPDLAQNNTQHHGTSQPITHTSSQHTHHWNKSFVHPSIVLLLALFTAPQLLCQWKSCFLIY